MTEEHITLKHETKAQDIILRAKRGRPSIYDNDFHPKEFVKLRRQGFSLSMVAARWDTIRQVLWDWTQIHKDFSDAYKKGHDACCAYYDNLEQNQSVDPLRGWNVVNQIQLRKRFCQAKMGNYAKKSLPEKIEAVNECYARGELDDTQYKTLTETIKAQSEIYKTLELVPRLEALEEAIKK